MSFYNNIPVGYNNRIVTIRHLMFKKGYANSKYSVENFGVAIKRDNGKEIRDWYMIPCGHNGWCSHHTPWCDNNSCDCEDYNWKELSIQSYSFDTGTLTFNLGDAFDSLKKGRYILRVYLNCDIVATFNLDWLPHGNYYHVDNGQSPSDSVKKYPVKKDCNTCDVDNSCGCKDNKPCGEFEDVVVSGEYEAYIDWRPKVVSKPVKEGSLPLRLNFIKNK